MEYPARSGPSGSEMFSRSFYPGDYDQAALLLEGFREFAEVFFEIVEVFLSNFGLRIEKHLTPLTITPYS